MGTESCCQGSNEEVNLLSSLKYPVIRYIKWPIKYKQIPGNNLPQDPLSIFLAPQVGQVYKKQLAQMIKNKSKFSDLSYQSQFWGIQQMNLSPAHALQPSATMYGQGVKSMQVNLKNKQTKIVQIKTYNVACVIQAIAERQILDGMILTKQNNLGFHLIRFMCNGVSTYLPIDDSIPIDKKRRPQYLKLDGVLWPCLLQKAWAKVIGGYDKQIQPHIIYEQMTGAPGQKMQIKQIKNFGQLLNKKLILQANGQQSICDQIGLSINQMVVVQQMYQIKQQQLQDKYGNYLFQLTVPYNNSGIKTTIIDVQDIKNITQKENSINFFITFKQLQLLFQDVFILHKLKGYRLMWQMAKNNFSTFLVTIKQKGQINLKIRQHFQAYTVGEGHKYFPFNISVWQKSGKQIIQTKDLRQGQRYLNIFQQDFYQLEKGQYIINIDACWHNIPYQARSYGLVLYGQQKTGCQIQLLNNDRANEILQQILKKKAIQNIKQPVKKILQIQNVIFDQQWFGSIGTIYIKNQGEQISKFILCLETCQNIFFQDTKKPESNKQFNIELQSQNDYLILFRAINCSKSSSIGNIFAKKQE